MSITNLETNVLTNVAIEFSKANSLDEVNKIYRQARNWSRYHCYFGGGCDSLRCRELNKTFKSMREQKLNELGGYDEKTEK